MDMIVEKTGTITFYGVTLEEEKEISVTVMYDENTDSTSIEMNCVDNNEEVEEGSELFDKIMNAINELE